MSCKKFITDAKRYAAIIAAIFICTSPVPKVLVPHTTINIIGARSTPPKRRAASIGGKKSSVTAVKSASIPEIFVKFYEEETFYSRSLESFQIHVLTKFTLIDVAWKARSPVLLLWRINTRRFQH